MNSGLDNSRPPRSVPGHDAQTPTAVRRDDLSRHEPLITDLTYDDANEPLREGYTRGTLGGFTVASTFNNSLQRDTLILNTQPSLSATYTYDSAGRLWTVAQGGSLATYTYLANSMLVGQITFAQSGTTRMTTTKNYDKLNRLTNVVSSAASALSSAYRYNDANQRTGMTNADNSFWIYGYDPLGQVTSGKKYWSDPTPVAGQQKTNRGRVSTFDI